MEKSIPHNKLAIVKSMVQAGQVRATGSAFQGARGVGVFSLGGMCDVILSLQAKDFYKSMTTHADHRIWQDVYHTRTVLGVEVYLKLTVLDGVLIVSFKEL